MSEDGLAFVSLGVGGTFVLSSFLIPCPKSGSDRVDLGFVSLSSSLRGFQVAYWALLSSGVGLAPLLPLCICTVCRSRRDRDRPTRKAAFPLLM